MWTLIPNISDKRFLFAPPKRMRYKMVLILGIMIFQGR